MQTGVAWFDGKHLGNNFYILEYGTINKEGLYGVN